MILPLKCQLLYNFAPREFVVEMVRDMKTDLNKADLNKADLNKADLNKADLNKADLNKADLNNR